MKESGNENALDQLKTEQREKIELEIENKER
jgi:hypothetical protein